MGVRSPAVPPPVTWGTLSGKPVSFPPASHTHPWGEITAKPTTFPPEAHSHAWADITGKPTTFAPAAHTHVWTDITDRPTIPAGNTLLGTVTLSENALVAISAGVRRLTMTTPTNWGVAPGQNLLLFATSLPSGSYATHDVIATAANTIQVGLTAPLLAIGASYSITARLVRINT